MTCTHALSIRQPWASAIIDGPKRVENRSWRPLWQLPQWIAVHASAGAERNAEGIVANWRGIHRGLWDVQTGAWPVAPVWTAWTDTPYRTGVLLGAVEVLDVLPESEVDDAWAAGPLCWMLGRVVRLPTPLPATGRLGLWPLSRDDREAVEAAIALEIARFDVNGRALL